jgi:2-iminobutanoate/2-iminopropanoate deaminase
MKRFVYTLILFIMCFSVYSQTKEVPKPVAPYSQSRMTSSGMLFVSGQIPVKPESGELLKGDIKAEAKQVMKNIGAILKANNMDFSDLVKCTIFLTDIRDYAAVNEVYAGFFKNEFPAREAIEISNLPLGASIEISAIASK